MDLLKVDIVSPSGQVVSGRDVSVLIIPSATGELAILPGHTDFLCLVGKGLLKLDDKDSFIIYKGIMEISDGEKVIIAAEKIKKMSELDINETKNRLKEIENKLLNEILDDVALHETREEYEDKLAELNSVI